MTESASIQAQNITRPLRDAIADLRESLACQNWSDALLVLDDILTEARYLRNIVNQQKENQK